MRRIWLVLVLAAAGAMHPVAQTQAPPATEIYLAPFVEGDKKVTQIGIVTIERSGVSVGKAVNITNNPGYDNQPCFLPDSSGVLFSSRPDWVRLAVVLAGAAMFAGGRHLRARALRRLVIDHEA